MTNNDTIQVPNLSSLVQENGETIINSDSSKHILPEIVPLSWKFWQKKRYIVVLLTFLGLFNVYALRVNMSIGIVAMTEIETIHYPNGTSVEHQYFNWNSKEKGLVLSSFFYGYITTQFAGGWLSAKYPATMIFGIGILMTSILTVLTPVAAHFGIYYVIAIRIIEGFFEGATFPALNGIWSRWAPPKERARMNSLAFAGNYVGTVVAMPVSSVLADNLGWESIFYVFGAVGCVWWLLWVFVIKDTPAKDVKISQDESRYIQETIGFKTTDKLSIPWKSLLTSVPMYAIIAAHFTENWGVYTMITQLPTFLTEVLDYSLQMAGFLSGIPYFLMAILLPLAGFLADYGIIRGIINKTQARKYPTCCSYFAQTIFLLLAAWLMHPIYSMLCIVIGCGIGAFAYSGFCTNMLDIAPQHSSVIMGISNTIATIPGIVSPTLTGFLVQNSTIDEWRIVFYISASIYLGGGIIYWIWCSGEIQSWAIQEPKPMIIVPDVKFDNKLSDDADDDHKRAYYVNNGANIKE